MTLLLLTKPSTTLRHKTLGLLATIVGALYGGILMQRLSLFRALLIFGILQGASNAGYWLLSITDKHRIGGFLLASKGSIDYPLFIYTLVGVSLVVASGCVFNNYIDRDIDRKMERTKNRVLVKGLISPAVSLVYATLLGIAGFMLLWFGANPLACWLGVMGFVVYVGVYSLYMKRHSVYGTLIGSLSGAAPPVIGYCAVTGEFDSGAAILLAIFSLWQMPHSYAIAIFRFKDYQAANIPVENVS